MTRLARQLFARLLLVVAAVALATGSATALAQYAAPRFDQPTLDSMLAPIALYPDALLSHVLMAATYPDEVAEAAEWLRARPGLSGDAAVRTSEPWDFEPSVRSLLAFPMVLETMASHLRWTEDVGQAFLGQREAVLDTVQALRLRAYEAGTLRSNEAVRVTRTLGGIVIEQISPQTVHIPHYDPRVAYGGWWWPTRPPVYWPRWHGYYDPQPRGHYLAWGPAIHVSNGFFFGGFVWPRREVHIVHTRPYYYPRHYVERRVVPGRGPVVVHREAKPGVWRHQDWRRDGDGRDGPRAGRDDGRRDDRRWEREPREGRDWERQAREGRRGDRDNDGRAERRGDRDDDGRRDGPNRSQITRTEIPPREGPSGYRSAAPERSGEYRTRPFASRDTDGGPDARNRSEMQRGQRIERSSERTVPREAPRSAERSSAAQRGLDDTSRREEIQTREVRRQRGRDYD